MANCQRLGGIVLLCAGILSPMLALAAESGAPGLDAQALLRVGLGLIVVLLVILALGWIMRRVGTLSGGLGGQLRVVGAVSLGNRERAVLVQVGDEQLLIGVSPGQVRTLHKLPQPLDLAASRQGSAGGSAPSAGFAARLQQALQRQDANRS